MKKNKHKKLNSLYFIQRITNSVVKWTSLIASQIKESDSVDSRINQ